MHNPYPGQQGPQCQQPQQPQQPLAAPRPQLPSFLQSLGLSAGLGGGCIAGVIIAVIAVIVACCAVAFFCTGIGGFLFPGTPTPTP